MEVCGFGPQRAMITCTFRARDFKTKNCLSRTPKVLQKYAQKVHSHWFICPEQQWNNWRTNTSSARVGMAIVLTCFFTDGYGQHRKFHTAGTGVNVLTSNFIQELILFTYFHY